MSKSAKVTCVERVCGLNQFTAQFSSLMIAIRPCKGITAIQNNMDTMVVIKAIQLVVYLVI
jgi:hypothetical protein